MVCGDVRPRLAVLPAPQQRATPHLAPLQLFSQLTLKTNFIITCSFLQCLPSTVAFPVMAAIEAFSFASGAFSCVSFQILAGKLLLLVLFPTLPRPSLLYAVEKG